MMASVKRSGRVCEHCTEAFVAKAIGFSVEWVNGEVPVRLRTARLMDAGKVKA